MALFAGAALAGVAGCASFPGAPAAFSPAPSLTPSVVTVVPSSPAAPPAVSPGTTSSPSPGADPTEGSAPSTSTDGPAPNGGSLGATDPCAPPPEPPVVAVCLDEPWGLAPLPDGQSALVGERVSGRILRVTAGHEPTVVTTIAGVDASHGGGLKGIALSPYYVEDSLVYAYVTTATDARIVRIAPVGEPKVIVSGLPVAGSVAGAADGGADGAAAGGSIAFGSDGLLYVVTGDDVLRFDTFGKPVGKDAGTAAGTTAGASASTTEGTTAGGSGSEDAVIATGLVDPTGICPLPGGGVGVLDHRSTGDALIIVTAGADYTTLGEGQTLWTFGAGSSGATDCAISAGALLTTARTAPRATRIEMRAAGGFSGEPEALLDGQYGLLRTAVTGPGDLVWLTTANGLHGSDSGSSGSGPGGDSGKGHQGSGPSDDRVIVLPAGGGGGTGGLD